MPLLSRIVRDQRMAKVVPHIRGSVLDLGCGNGSILAAVQDQIEDYIGVDHSENLIKQLQSQFPGYKFYKYDLDVDELEFPHRFDVITLIALIEHVFNQKHLFSQLVPLLKPEGKIVLTTPTPFGNDVVHRIGARLGLFSPQAASDHICIFNKKRLEILANEVGLVLEDYSTFQFLCNQIAVLKQA